MTIKESLVKRIEQMNEQELERSLEVLTQSSTQEVLREEFRLLEELASPMPQRDLETLTFTMRRRPFFGLQSREPENT